ncbi:polysaccharide deacetylase family protein [Pseudonocardia sp. Cha107L01]|uniref:polysaccharide deacetylase family protein n=1 Tax=Pseudonocardia sp. Cha107L01 TaxID=3457576 RepID=UPI00403ED32D
MKLRTTASVSLDMDNLWSYLKTHGDPDWERRPSYLLELLPRMLDLFDGHDLTATIFVVGADAAREDGAKAVAELAAAGHEIGNHSFEHEPWLHLYPRSRMEDELSRTEDAVVAAGAPRPTGFRGPGYSLSADLLELLAERGYLYDASTLPTWIGPLARAYYLRASDLSEEERRRRKALFGSARDGLRPVHPYRWLPHDLLELPVTTMPLARVPMHVSYLIHLHGTSPRLARAFFRTALAACRLRGVGPSLLLHPLDLLDARHAPGLEFFPGMAMRAEEKARVLDWALTTLSAQFDVVGTGEHVRRIDKAGVSRSRSAASATPTESIRSTR